MNRVDDRGPVRPPTLGVRANLAQFNLLVAVNALASGMLGQEPTLLPLLAKQVFHLDAYVSALTFIVAFGPTKAVTNLAAGAWCDRFGRKPVLVAGWLIAVPVPILLMAGPTWGWILVANVLLGVSQGMTWSTTVIMKIDLAGPAQRGMAMGLTRPLGTEPSRSPRWQPATLRRAPGYDPNRSSSASPSPLWVSACPRSRSARPMGTRGTKHGSTASPIGRSPGCRHGGNATAPSVGRQRPGDGMVEAIFNGQVGWLGP